MSERALQPDYVLLATVRIWFDAWAISTDLLSAAAATTLPEFRPMLASLTVDADQRQAAAKQAEASSIEGWKNLDRLYEIIKASDRYKSDGEYRSEMDALYADAQVQRGAK